MQGTIQLTLAQVAMLRIAQEQKFGREREIRIGDVEALANYGLITFDVQPARPTHPTFYFKLTDKGQALMDAGRVERQGVVYTLGG